MVTHQSCNHAIYQNNKKLSLKNKEVEPVKPVQINAGLSMNGVRLHSHVPPTHTSIYLCLVPTAAITFIALGNEIWSPQIHCPKFIARAFPPLARIQC